jgi:hypothetical protein
MKNLSVTELNLIRDKAPKSWATRSKRRPRKSTNEGYSTWLTTLSALISQSNTKFSRPIQSFSVIPSCGQYSAKRMQAEQNMHSTASWIRGQKTDMRIFRREYANENTMGVKVLRDQGSNTLLATICNYEIIEKLYVQECLSDAA